MAGEEALDRADVEHGRVARRRELVERRRRGEERATVELHDPLHVWRPWRARGPCGAGDERLDRGERERRIEPPLEADRRRGLRAHALAAQGAGDVAGIDLDTVPEL